jgi:predicted DCC family thiol-disulfide oxidoreductase YuxK
MPVNPAISEQRLSPPAATEGPVSVVGQQLVTAADPPSQSSTLTAQASSPSSVVATDHPVIFYDGVCGLCNRWVDFVLTRDRRQRFQFAPLQGETARTRLKITGDQPLNSVVLVDHAGEYRKSDAIWRMLMQLGGVWRIAGTALRLVPRPLRNCGYDCIARHRYRLFGKKESCRLPTRGERERFLP